MNKPFRAVLALACLASLALGQVAKADPIYTYSPLPPGAPIVAASGNVANTNAVATLAAAPGKTTFITGFRCDAAGATAGLAVSLTVAGLLGGTLTYAFTFPTGAAVGAWPVEHLFVPPLAASTVNTAIVVTLPAGGAGNTNATCNATGFQL
jgi:hypothetical protein